MGFQDVVRTQGTRDKGVDVRGALVVADAIRVPFAVQVKQQKGNVGSPKVQELRGSLAADERGLFVTTSDFTKGARDEATRSGAPPITLINGEKLAELLVANAERLKEEAEADDRGDLRELVVERGPVVLLNLDQSTSSAVWRPVDRRTECPPTPELESRSGRNAIDHRPLRERRLLNVASSGSSETQSGPSSPRSPNRPSTRDRKFRLTSSQSISTRSRSGGSRSASSK